MSTHIWRFPLRDHAVLIWGALGATFLGGLTALQFDLVIAVGERLMHPAGPDAVIKTTVTAGLVGLLCWVICALVTRAISRAALKPYDTLTDHFERLADGGGDGPIDLHGPVAGVRRLARAVIVFQQRDLASQRSEAQLQSRFDRLYEEQADERRLLMGILMKSRVGTQGRSSTRPSIPAPSAAEFALPDLPGTEPLRTGEPIRHTGEVVDLAGRFRSPAADIENRPHGLSLAATRMPLDFALVRR